MGFRDYMKEYCPPWLQGPNGLAWVRALGDVKDGMTGTLKERVAARFPIRPSTETLPAIAPTGALDALGREQQMPRALGESDSEYAQRLADAFGIWSYAGTAYGLLRALKAAGFGTARICIAKGKRYHLDEAGALVVEAMPAGSWCTQPAPQTFWSRFVVLFDVATGIPPDWYDPPEFAGIDERQDLFDPMGTTTDGPFLVIDEGSGVIPTAAIQSVIIRIDEPGFYDSVTYSYSLDEGATWLPYIDTSDVPNQSLVDAYSNPIGLMVAHFGTDGVYNGGEVYRWPLIFNPVVAIPGEEALRIRGLRQHIEKWKAACSSCFSIVIVEAGYCFDTLPASFDTWAAVADLSGNVVYDYHP